MNRPPLIGNPMTKGLVDLMDLIDSYAVSDRGPSARADLQVHIMQFVKSKLAMFVEAKESNDYGCGA